MILVEPKVWIVEMTPDPLHVIETAARNCYKSEKNMGNNEDFLLNLIKRNPPHISVFEHAYMTVRIICSRSCSHQLVRHRIASYSQESQRYCKYDGKLEIIPPKFVYDETNYAPSNSIPVWRNAINTCEEVYCKLLANGIPAEDARSVLPNCTKTEIVMSANFREWFAIFRERAWNDRAQYEIREIMLNLVDELQKKFPKIKPILKTLQNQL